MSFSAACAAKEEPAATPKPAATQAPVVKATPTPVPTVALAPTVAPAQVRPTHWTWAIAQNPTVSFDPLGGGQSGQVRQTVFDPLIYDGGPEVAIENFLAEDWKFITPTHVRFNLRKGVKFHNGDPFTAEDVKYTWETAIGDPKNSWGLKMSPEVQALEVVDPYTFDVKFKRQFGPVITDIRSGLMAPKAHRQRVGAGEFTKNPIGTGAYKFVSVQVDQKVDVEANKDYFLGPVFPPKMTFIWIREATTRTAAVLSGTVDAANTIAHEEIPRLEKELSLELILTNRQKSRVSLNYGDPPFNNENLRKALNYAVDKDAIVNDLLEGRGEILAAGFMKGNMGYDPNLKPYPYDPNKARSLVKEAGLTGTSFEFTSTSGIRPKDRETSLLMAGYWAAVGLKPQLKFITRELYLESRVTRTFQICNCAQWADNPDMDSEVNWDYLDPGFKVNRRLDSDTPLAQELRKLYDEQRATVDVAKRDPIFRQIDRFAYDHALSVYTHASDVYIAVSRKLDWHQYPRGSFSGYFYDDHWLTRGLKPVPIFKTR